MLRQILFENTVFYNEQPYCELVSAQFFELDLSPCPTELNEIFDTLREKNCTRSNCENFTSTSIK
ncbi:hypothetical protein bcgnr5376_48680 [Bacillus cereus]